jgi:ATP-dependent DNA helicase RecG
MLFIENEHMELKLELTEETKKEIVAFANTTGGKVILGVDDDGEVVGLKDATDVQLRLTNMIRDTIKPDLTMFVSYEQRKSDDKDILIVHVQSGTQRPYYISSKGLSPSGVYVRQGTSSAPASNEFIRKLIKETDGDSYESKRSLQQDLTFIQTQEEFRKRQLEFAENQMVSLGMVMAYPRIYSNVAFLLSDQCTFTTKVAIFQGVTKEVFKDRREFGGSLLKQLNDVYEYIDLSNRLRAEISGLLRIDRRDYPEVAIREALLNAIVHREYSLSSSTLISIMEDRIEFVSVGGLVTGVTLEDIKLGVSICRNEKLAAIFYRLRLIEAYGTGIAKMMSSYINAPVKPEIAHTENAFRITLPNLNVGSFDLLMPRSPQEQWIMNWVQERKVIGRKEVQAGLGISQTYAGKLLRELVQRNELKSIGVGKKTQYIRSDGSRAKM